MVLIGGNKVTKFSYLEYQLLMLSLAFMICTAIGGMEIVMRRFQVLPLLFPGTFTVREKRFYFFNFDITEGTIGKKIRAEAKMVIRITVCVVLSYLWQHCVLETTQTLGKEFPKDQCAEEHDCFASEFHFVTLFDRNHEAIDCKGPDADFDKRVVVSCIHFITPSATTLLMHLAIANSVTQLTLKAFEVIVWIAGNSRVVRRVIAALTFVTLSIFVGLFFGGLMSEFVTSWLSFVMSLAMPAFLHTTWKCAKSLELLWMLDAIQVQQNIEKHLNDAFTEIEQRIALESNGVTQQASQSSQTRTGSRTPSSNTGSRAVATFRRLAKGASFRFGSIMKKDSKAKPQRAPSLEARRAPSLEGQFADQRDAANVEASQTAMRSSDGLPMSLRDACAASLTGSVPSGGGVSSKPVRLLDTI